jgi:hypothetical protein
MVFSNVERYKFCRIKILVTNNATQTDTYRVPKEDFSRCIQDFGEDNFCKYDSAIDVVDEMIKHFSSVRLQNGSHERPRIELSAHDFMKRMQAKVGLEVVRVNDRVNGFWDSVSLAYFGKRGDKDLYRSFRGTVAAYILSIWKDKPVRDILVGSHKSFVRCQDKTVDLHGYLSRLSDPNEPIILPKRPKECIEILCTALMLGCRLSVLSLSCDDVVHCEDVGNTTSKLRVFVALNGCEFFGFSFKTSPSFEHAASSSSPSSRAPDVVSMRRDFVPPQPLCTAPSQFTLPARAIHPMLPPQTPLSAPSQSTSSTTDTEADFPGWGVAPPQNSDAHLRPTWPETEAVLRSLSLYNGIWTDAQSLQYTNWTHRVSLFPYIICKY